MTLAALALAAALLAGHLASGQMPAPQGSTRLPETAAAAAPPPTVAHLPRAAAENAAAAMRRRDCAGAVNALADAAADDADPDAAFARLVQGLYAHACEDVALAESKLFAAGGASGPLEDWRLLTLADSSAALDHLLVARAALVRLVGDHPHSPLRPRALRRSAELAWRSGDSHAALEAVETARREGIGGETAAALEELAWQIAGAVGDPVARAEAGRRLLITAPLVARRLAVDDALRTAGEDGGLAAVLGAEGMMERAASFLALDMAAAAHLTLEAVPPASRDAAWHVLAARALTSEQRGVEALRLLANARHASPREEAEIEWARALAALDAAAVRRGRHPLPAGERQRLREEAHRHLARSAALDAAPELTARALSRLFRETSDDAPFEVTMELLRRLRSADPDDRRGADYLWDRGWQEYRRRNHSGAVGYWSELTDLYPDHPLSRSARYWSGRAFEELGDTARARRIYAEVASADTSDFYRQHALSRLGGGSQVIGGTLRERPPARWPIDPVLDRARLLADLGLDDLALSELAATSAGSEPRAAAALSALVLARRGDRRDSISRIREAFPALGGPYQAGLPAEALRLYYPLDFEAEIRSQADNQRLPLNLVYGMIRQESAFDTSAKSWAGAHGLMQVMPATGREVARRLGVAWATSRLREPAYNLRLGTAYFRQVLSMFDGNVELALAGYNGGPYRIKRLWRESGGADRLDLFVEALGIPESKTYVKRILLLSDSYRQLYPDGTRGGADVVPSPPGSPVFDS